MLTTPSRSFRTATTTRTVVEHMPNFEYHAGNYSLEANVLGTVYWIEQEGRVFSAYRSRSSGGVCLGRHWNLYRLIKSLPNSLHGAVWYGVIRRQEVEFVV